MSEVKTKKPNIRLVGESDNAFAILGRCARVLRKNGYTKEEIDSFLEEAKAGDYEHLLGTVVKHFNVE